MRPGRARREGLTASWWVKNPKRHGLFGVGAVTSGNGLPHLANIGNFNAMGGKFGLNVIGRSINGKAPRNTLGGVGYHRIKGLEFHVMFSCSSEKILVFLKGGSPYCDPGRSIDDIGARAEYRLNGGQDRIRSEANRNRRNLGLKDHGRRLGWSWGEAGSAAFETEEEVTSIGAESDGKTSKRLVRGGDGRPNRARFLGRFKGAIMQKGHVKLRAFEVENEVGEPIVKRCRPVEDEPLGRSHLKEFVVTGLPSKVEETMDWIDISRRRRNRWINIVAGVVFKTRTGRIIGETHKRENDREGRKKQTYCRKRLLGHQEGP